jgi:hypothetical protein
MYEVQKRIRGEWVAVKAGPFRSREEAEFVVRGLAGYRVRFNRNILVDSESFDNGCE